MASSNNNNDNDNDNAGTERKVKSCSKYTADCVDCDWSQPEWGGGGWWTASTFADRKQQERERESERAYRKRNKDAAPGCGQPASDIVSGYVAFRTTFIHTHTHSPMHVWVLCGVCWRLPSMYAYIYVFFTLCTHERALLYVCMFVDIQQTYMHIPTCIDMFYFIKAV